MPRVAHAKVSRDQLRVAEQIAKELATQTPSDDDREPHTGEGGNASRRLEFKTGDNNKGPAGEKATPSSTVTNPPPAAADSEEGLTPRVRKLARQVAMYDPSVPHDDLPEVITDVIFLVNNTGFMSSRAQSRLLTQYMEAPKVKA
jgi:hypothetical protein